MEKTERQENPVTEDVTEDNVIRKAGILKRKMVMSEDFDETPECFEEYM